MRMQSTNLSLRMTSAERRASLSLAGIFALRMLGNFLILPVFAIYASELPGGDDHFWVGITLGVYGLTQGILQIPYGMASDRWGRKPIIIIGLLIFALGSFLAAIADNLTVILLGRALQGAGAISAAVTAFISDTVRDRVLNKAMALVGASIGLTFALSLVIAPPLTQLWGIPGLFILTGMMALSAIAIVCWVTPPETMGSDSLQASPQNHRRWQDILLDPQLLRLNLGIFILHAILTALFVVIPGRLESMGLPVLHHWYIYLPAVLFGFATMMKPINWAERQNSIVDLQRIVIVVLAIVLVLFVFLLHSIWEIAFLLALFFGCFNILEATLPGLISKAAPKADKGLALGIYNTTQNIGLFIGGAAGGWLSKHFSTEAVFVASAFAMLVWLVGTRKLCEPRRMTHESGEALDF